MSQSCVPWVRVPRPSISQSKVQRHANQRNLGLLVTNVRDMNTTAVVVIDCDRACGV